MTEDEQKKNGTEALDEDGAFTVAGKMFFPGTMDPEAISNAIVAQVNANHRRRGEPSIKKS